MQIADGFKSEIRASGLNPPEIIEPGRIYRFPGLGKGNGNRAGWCKLFEDGQGGVYGDWSSGISGSWKVNRDKPLSPIEQAAFRKKCAETRKAQESELAEIHAKIAIEARKILDAATADPSGHLYIKDKRISPTEGIKRGAWPQRGWPDALLIPLYDQTGKLTTVQAINADGKKDFLKNGKKAGCSYSFGNINGARRVLIGEGYATVAVVCATTEIPGVAAVDAGNLLPVAQSVRRLAPKAEIVFLADNDVEPEGNNPGVKATKRAAKSVRGLTAIPRMDDQKCDFWDLWNERGAGAVQSTLKKVGVFLPSTYTSNALMQKDFPPVKWAVPGILPEGVSLLGGAPKIGKSWASINLSVAVSKGGNAFGRIPCDAGDVLYLALEDNPRRMQSRLKSSGLKEGIEGLHFAHEWRRVDEGGADDLDQWLTVHPDARLVIIDTLAKIRPKKIKAGKSAYDLDYEALEPLLPIAARHRVSVLVVCHTRKMKSDDPLELISGTLGLTGGVDGVLVMEKKREDPRCALFVTGRDIEKEMAHVMQFDHDTKTWILTDEKASEVMLPDGQAEVLDCIKKLPSPTASDVQKSIATSNGRRGLKPISISTVKKHLERLREKGLIRHDGNGYSGVE